MDITLCVNTSEKNKLGKSLVNEHIYSGTLKEETSVTNSVILMEIENPTGYNYAYIPEFGRYYFISDMTAVRDGLWRVSMAVDVLESFKNEIRNLSVIISDSEIAGIDKYMSGDVWKSKVKETTSIINFPNGLSENGNYILITAGGDG